MKILLVEDDESHARFVMDGLKQAGHTVDHAKDGMDGLFLATEEKYDVMILDRMVPKLDGLAVIQALRTNGGTSHRGRDERADSRPPCQQALVLQRAVCLHDRVRIDRHLSNDVLHRRDLVACFQQTQPKCPTHLLDELEIWGHPRLAVDPELDHSFTIYLVC